jgi:hypothetical protein
MWLEAGTAGTAEAGIILIATELGLQDQVTVGQLRLVDALPAQVPGLGGWCCRTTGERRGEADSPALCKSKAQSAKRDYHFHPLASLTSACSGPSVICGLSPVNSPSQTDTPYLLTRPLNISSS